MQGGKTQKKSTMQQISKLWNPTYEIFATYEIGRGKELLQDRELISCRITNLLNGQFQLVKFSQVAFELAKSTYNLRYLRIDS